MRSIRRTGRLLSAATRQLLKVTAPLRLFFFRYIVAIPYRLWRKVRSATKWAAEHTHGARLLQYTQGTVYLVLVCAIFVSLNNWRIRGAAAEDFGQKNLIFPLIEQELGSAAESIFSPLPEDDTPEVPDGSTGTPTEQTDEAGNTVPIILLADGTTILRPHITQTEPGIAARTTIEYHIVEAGDTLSSIAKQYGLSLATLLWENNLTERSLLRIGAKLSILPVDGISYRIGRGDTLIAIANKFKAKSDDIAEFNKLGSKLVVGDTIVIPGGRPAAVARPAPSRPAAPAATAPAAAPSSAGSGSMLWPTVRRRITQYYSWRHTGVDIADGMGTPIYAAEDGIVEVAGWNRGGYGYYIIIDHGGGIKTLYGHNSKMLVSVGERVERGQQIANMGSTGRSTGPHVHFEVRVNGRRTNPLNYVR